MDKFFRNIIIGGIVVISVSVYYAAVYRPLKASETYAECLDLKNKGIISNQASPNPSTFDICIKLGTKSKTIQKLVKIREAQVEAAKKSARNAKIEAEKAALLKEEANRKMREQEIKNKAIMQEIEQGIADKKEPCTSEAATKAGELQEHVKAINIEWHSYETDYHSFFIDCWKKQKGL